MFLDFSAVLKRQNNDELRYCWSVCTLPKNRFQSFQILKKVGNSNITHYINYSHEITVLCLKSLCFMLCWITDPYFMFQGHQLGSGLFGQQVLNLSYLTRNLKVRDTPVRILIRILFFTWHFCTSVNNLFEIISQKYVLWCFRIGNC